MKKININMLAIIKTIIYIILLIPFFKPRSLLYGIADFSNFYHKLSLISFIVILILTIKKKRVSKSIMYIAIYLLILLISTYFNKGDINNCINIIIETLTLSLIIDYGTKYNTSVFLSAFNIFLYSLVIINFVSIFVYPNGMYVDTSNYADNWFLGFKNVHILFILPAIAISFINSYYHRKKFTVSNYVLLIISMTTLIKVNSSTSIVGVFIIILFLIAIKVVEKTGWINIKNFSIAYIIAFFAIVIFRLQNIFAFIIVDVLKKDLSFTNRTFIWDNVIGLITEKPFIGYGVETNAIRLSRTISFRSVHAHNQILEILYKTGIIGIIPFIMIVVSAFKELMKYKNNILSKLLSIIMLVWMIMMLTEAYLFEYFIYFFVICANIKYLINREAR